MLRGPLLLSQKISNVLSALGGYINYNLDDIGSEKCTIKQNTKNSSILLLVFAMKLLYDTSLSETHIFYRTNARSCPQKVFWRLYVQ